MHEQLPGYTEEIIYSRVPNKRVGHNNRAGFQKYIFFILKTKEMDILTLEMI